MGMDLITSVLVADAGEDHKASLDWDAGFKFIETASADDLSWVDMADMMYCEIETNEETGDTPTAESVENLRATYRSALTDVRDTIEYYGRCMNVFTMFGKNFYLFGCESWGDVAEIIDHASIIQFSDGLMKAIGFYTDFSVEALTAGSPA